MNTVKYEKNESIISRRVYKQTHQSNWALSSQVGYMEVIAFPALWLVWLCICWWIAKDRNNLRATWVQLALKPWRQQQFVKLSTRVFRKFFMLIYNLCFSDIVKLYNHELQIYSDPAAHKWLEDMAYRIVRIDVFSQCSLIWKKRPALPTTTKLSNPGLNLIRAINNGVFDKQ